MKIKYFLISLVFCSLGFSQQILFLSPNQGLQGTVDLQVTLVATGTNFHDEYGSVNVYFSGNGMNATNEQIISYNTLEFDLDIESWADIGNRDVTLNYYNWNWGEEWQTTKTDAFTVLENTAEITSIDPNSVQAGSSTLITIYGNDTNWDENSTVSFSGGGITVDWISPFSTQLWVQISVDQWAYTTWRDVTVTTGNVSVALQNGLLITPPPPLEIISIVPESGEQGTNDLTVSLVLEDFYDPYGTSSVSFSGDGIYVQNIWADPDYSNNGIMNVNVDINSWATLGERDVTVGIGPPSSGQWQYATLYNGFWVDSSDHQLISITPNQSYPAIEDLQVTLIGANTNWGSNSPQLSFEGSGIYVNWVNAVSNTELNAQIDIRSWANVGLRDVTVTSGEQIVSLQDGFEVRSPEIISLTPSAGVQGTYNIDVSLVAGGVNFYDSYGIDNIYFSGSGLSTSSYSITSDSSVTFQLDISYSATAGTRDVYLNYYGYNWNLYEISKMDAFTVIHQDSVENILSVVSDSVWNDTTSLIVPIVLETYQTVGGMQFIVSDDPDYFTMSDAITDIDGFEIIVSELPNGSIQVTLFSTTGSNIPPGFNGTICEIAYDVMEGVGNVTVYLLLTDINLLDPSGSPIEVTGVSGQIVFSPIEGLTANFEADVTEGIAPLTVLFSDLSDTINTTIISWEWDFGDSSTSTEENPTHVYGNAGVYTVSLTVGDGENEDTEIKTDYINVVEPNPIIWIDQSPIDFGEIGFNQEANIQRTVYNVGNIDLMVFSGFVSGTEGLTISPDTLVIPPADTSAYLNIILSTGLEELTITDTLILFTNDIYQSEILIPVSAAIIPDDSPVIIFIDDVPNDQGGKVVVSFTRSYYDDDSLTARTPEGYSIEIEMETGWTGVASNYAYGSPTYAILVLTPFDSSNTSDGLINFRVIAAMEEGNFVSDVAQGYSVDNIAPAIPTNLILSYSGDMVVLTWDPPVNEDFQYFSVYRNGELADYTVEPEFVEIQSDAEYYVTATDANGNESEPSETASGYSMTVDYQSDWNLVGLPLDVEDASYSNLFPESIDGTLYSFDISYNLASMLVPGEGYWLRFDNAGSSTITGAPINELTISLNEDWNLISGLSEDVSIYSVYDPDSIIVPGTLYGFNGGYIETDMLVPGKGYWLRAYQYGDITLNSGALAKVKPYNFSLKDKANSLTINDTELYFGLELSDKKRLSYSLPPKPPSGAFDVRFSGDTRITGENSEIEVMNPYENITISYDILLDASEHMNWVLTSASGEEYTLEGTGEITVPTEETFTLERIAIIPIAYTLHQNYPNPFNPITSLRYDLPEQAQVTLTIYDLMGKEVAQLVNTTQEAGYRSVQWNATDMHGKSVSAGVYLYQIHVGEFVQTRKMVLLK